MISLKIRKNSSSACRGFYNQTGTRLTELSSQNGIKPNIQSVSSCSEGFLRAESQHTHTHTHTHTHLRHPSVQSESLTKSCSTNLIKAPLKLLLFQLSPSPPHLPPCPPLTCARLSVDLQSGRSWSSATDLRSTHKHTHTHFHCCSLK